MLDPDIIYELAVAGCSPEEIALDQEVEVDYLVQRYQQQLDRGANRFIINLRLALAKAANGGEATVIKYLHERYVTADKAAKPSAVSREELLAALRRAT